MKYEELGGEITKKKRITENGEHSSASVGLWWAGRCGV